MQRLIVILAILIAAACRGAAPPPESGQPAAQGRAAESPPSTGPLTVEWTDADLERNASQIGYGATKVLLRRQPDGALVFSPETPNDHLATAFTPLQSYSGSRTIELIVDAQAPGGGTCAANLQDQAYNVLTTVPCKTAGEQRQTVTVPQTVNSVRVYFISPSREPVHLPNRIRLVEHR